MRPKFLPIFLLLAFIAGEVYATPNAQHVAGAMDRIVEFGFAEERIPTLFGALSELPESNRAGAFTQLHGEMFAASPMNLIGMQQTFYRRLPSIRDRSRDTFYDEVFLGQSTLTEQSPKNVRISINFPFFTYKYSYGTDLNNSPDALSVPSVPSVAASNMHTRWTAFTGDWQDRRNVGSFSGYDLRNVGVIHAAENRSGNFFHGTALSYDNVYQKFDTIQSDCRIDIFRLALYSGSRHGNFSSDSYIGYTRNWSKTRRHIDFIDTPGAGGVARSRFTNNMFGLGFESRQDMRFGWSRLTPSMGMHYTHLSRLRAVEHGAGEANLSANARHFDSVRFPMGAKLSHDFWTGYFLWRPEVRAFYIREVADASVRTRTSFNEVREVPFFADSGKWGRNCGRFGTGLTVQMMDRLSFQIDYDYEVYEWTSASEFGMTLGVMW